MGMKHIYEIEDDPDSEVYQRRQQEFQNFQIQEENKRGAVWREQQRVIKMAKEKVRIDSENWARKEIEKEKSDFEKLQSPDFSSLIHLPERALGRNIHLATKPI